MGDKYNLGNRFNHNPAGQWGATLVNRYFKPINPDKLGIFGDHFSTLKIGSMLNRSGISKKNREN